MRHARYKKGGGAAVGLAAAPAGGTLPDSGGEPPDSPFSA